MLALSDPLTFLRDGAIPGIDQYPIRVSDLKQWVYCPRVFYFQHCLPDVRPTTFKMHAGVEAGR